MLASNPPKTEATPGRRLWPLHNPCWPTAGSPSGSSPRFESKREPFGESRFPDCSLGAFDVVSDSTKLKGLVVRIPHTVARQRAPVARLANAARIDKRGPAKGECVD